MPLFPFCQSAPLLPCLMLWSAFYQQVPLVQKPLDSSTALSDTREKPPGKPVTPETALKPPNNNGEYLKIEAKIGLFGRSAAR